MSTSYRQKKKKYFPTQVFLKKNSFLGENNEYESISYIKKEEGPTTRPSCKRFFSVSLIRLFLWGMCSGLQWHTVGKNSQGLSTQIHHPE